MIRFTRSTPAGQRLQTLFLACCLIASDVGLSHAQDTTSARRDGWIVGPLIGLPGVGSEYELRFFTAGVGVTRLVPNRPGLDFAIGTMPRVAAKGLVPIAARIGPAIPFALGTDAFIIPSVGLSGAAAASGEGGGALGGYYLGAATVVARGSVGLRAGITWHLPSIGGSSVWLVEIGVMHVPVSRRKR